MGIGFWILGAGLIAAVACLAYGYPNGTDMDDAYDPCFRWDTRRLRASRRSHWLARLSGGLTSRLAPPLPSDQHLAVEALAEEFGVCGLSKTEHDVIAVVTSEAPLARTKSSQK